jgi:hypothetical protein
VSHFLPVGQGILHRLLGVDMTAMGHALLVEFLTLPHLLGVFLLQHLRLGLLLRHLLLVSLRHHLGVFSTGLSLF